MSAEDLNTALVEQFHRIGDKIEPIHAILTECGATGTPPSVNTLDPARYTEVLDKVRAL
jgi:hypothetical protein